jgi:hypothetical protein
VNPRATLLRFDAPSMLTLDDTGSRCEPFSVPTLDSLDASDTAEYLAWCDDMRAAASEVYDAEALSDANDDGDPRHGRLPSEDRADQWFSPHIVASAQVPSVVIPPCAADFADLDETIPAWALNVQGRA